MKYRLMALTGLVGVAAALGSYYTQGSLPLLGLGEGEVQKGSAVVFLFLSAKGIIYSL